MAGGLLAYGPNFSDNYRRAASYVDKILNGTKRGDLPVEQPTTFEFVINLKTALGRVPEIILSRMDSREGERATGYSARLKDAKEDDDSAHDEEEA